MKNEKAKKEETNCNDYGPQVDIHICKDSTVFLGRILLRIFNDAEDWRVRVIRFTKFYRTHAKEKEE